MRTRAREEETKNRERLKRQTQVGLKLSFGISCQDCGALSPLRKLRSEYGAKRRGMGDRVQNMTRPSPPFHERFGGGGGRGPPWLISCVLLAGRAGWEGPGLCISLVISMVLRCNCSITNNVVRLLVQTKNRWRRSRSRGADGMSQLL